MKEKGVDLGDEELKKLMEQGARLFAQGNSRVHHPRKMQNRHCITKWRFCHFGPYGKWLEYLSLKDKAVVAAMNLGIPPDVIISLGYPPSCVFNY